MAKQRNAPVIAKVDHIKGRQIAGVKGTMTIGAYETESVDGQVIQLSGGYHKEGKSRMALSITLGVLFILPIFKSHKDLSKSFFILIVYVF